MIIDATNLIIGRLASHVAKKALLGEKINIVNSENAIITGTKEKVFASFKRKRDMGNPVKGPFTHRSSDRVLRRIIRGMLPYKQEKGKSAFKRIMCWNGFPDQFKDQKIETVHLANVSKVPNLSYVKLSAVLKFLGGKSE